MTGPVQLGVLGGSAEIARTSVLPAVAASDGAELVASASRSGAHPDGVTHRFASYDDLLACDDVEAVYVPVPNGLHERWVVAAAAAGKHVLCEKPLATTAAAAERMAAACEDAGVVLMEAYMTPFHPRQRLLWQLLAEGRLGRLHQVRTHVSFVLADLGNHRVDPELGGGSLLDLGIYCLEPLLQGGGWQVGDALPQVAAVADWTMPGVDATTSGWLAFPNGVSGAFLSSFDAPDEQRVELIGTEATARITSDACTGGPSATEIEVIAQDGTRSTVDSAEGEQYRLMVEHFCDVVRGVAHQERPPARSVGLARLIDLVRTLAGPPQDP